MRAARASGVSSSKTGTTRCVTMGPPSRVSSTKWTVQPETRTPCSTACRCASRPGKAGSREGWMLSTRPRNSSTKQGESRRMKPARQTSSTPLARRTPMISRSCSSRVRPRRSTTAVSIPRSRAASSPAARGLSLTTRLTCAPGMLPAATASASAVMFDPRPEMRMPTRLTCAFGGCIGERSLGLPADVEHVNEPRLEVFAVPLRVVYRDDVARQTVPVDADADELIEPLDAGRAGDLVVVPVEGERDGEVPAEPDAAEQRAEQAGHQRRHQPPPGEPVEEVRQHAVVVDELAPARTEEAPRHPRQQQQHRAVHDPHGDQRPTPVVLHEEPAEHPEAGDDGEHDQGDEEQLPGGEDDHPDDGEQPLRRRLL